MHHAGAFPVIAYDVPIRAAARIVGGTRFGRGVKLAVGTVVLEDLPARDTAVDTPAELICAKELKPR